MITTGATKLLIDGTFGLQRDGMKNENNSSFINFVNKYTFVRDFGRFYLLDAFLFRLVANHILMTSNRMLNKEIFYI